MNTSLQYRLSLWVSLFIVVMGIVAGALSFYFASQDAYEFQDDQLKQISSFVATQDLSNNTKDDEMGAVGSDEEIIAQEITDERIVQNDRNEIDLPSNLPEHFSTWTSPDSEDWRVFVRVVSPNRKIAIAQRTAIRDEIAQDSGWRTVLPLLILMPCLIALVIVVIRRSLAPISKLAQELDQKTESKLHPLTENLAPKEIEPFVTSINALLARLSHSIEQQHRFIADAAHELRSPIHALTLQAENLQQTIVNDDGRQRLALLQQGLGRTRTLLEQLLTLARHQIQTSEAIEPTQIDVTELLHQTISELYPLAQSKNIDIGIDHEEPIQLQTDAFKLRTLMHNAIENAIRYTPESGQIDIRLFQQNDKAVFEVQDNGIGIAANELPRVFDPFYRVMGTGETGSGLGLSIVKKIAESLGGIVDLTSDSEQGTVFRYTQSL
ncbi:MAG: ATP-binding protein [Formosimonas sp.]